MINTKQVLMALTSHADQLMHMHVAVDLARENSEIFSALPAINKAIKSKLRDKSNFVDGKFYVGFALSSLVDSLIIQKYLESIAGVSEVKVSQRLNQCAVVYNLKITS